MAFWHGVSNRDERVDHLADLQSTDQTRAHVGVCLVEAVGGNQPCLPVAIYSPQVS